MSDACDILIQGSTGSDITVPGKGGDPAVPLGPEGNGQPGESTFFKGCVKDATEGKPGNTGGEAPKAEDGGAGANACSFLLRCVEYDAPNLSIISRGGNGGRGGAGGMGGEGGKGGNAGSQPTACKKDYGLTMGGRGGTGGKGGDAGDGGAAGSAGSVTVVYDKALAAPKVNWTGIAGQPGDPGDPGEGGPGGSGGLNGDGKTYADGHHKGSPGNMGQIGASGNIGPFKEYGIENPEYRVVITATA